MLPSITSLGHFCGFQLWKRVMEKFGAGLMTTLEAECCANVKENSLPLWFYSDCCVSVSVLALVTPWL